MKLTKKLPFLNRNKKRRKSKKGGSSQMVTKDKKLEYKDYNSELDIDKILSTEKSFEVILDKTSIELYINNFIGDNVRSSVPIYSVRLKAFDLF